MKAVYNNDRIVLSFLCFFRKRTKGEGKVNKGRKKNKQKGEELLEILYFRGNFWGSKEKGGWIKFPP